MRRRRHCRAVKPTPDFLGITAEQFIFDIILDRFRPVAIVEGPTFGFGQHRRGDVRMLAAAGQQQGFAVEVVEPVRVAMGGHPDAIVSSSLIRHLLSSGTVDGARLCLGRPYAIYGRVGHGHARGRVLGFPTANLETSQLIPGEGVYAARATLIASQAPGAGDARIAPPREEGPPMAAAVSVGRNPTFNDRELRIEAFLLDFSGDVYARELKLEFLAWLRPQEKYATSDALVEQVQRDVARTREIVGRETAPDVSTTPGAAARNPASD